MIEIKGVDPTMIAVLKMTNGVIPMENSSVPRELSPFMPFMV